MENLIPLFAIFCIFGLPVAALIAHRAMQHRERIEMIRNGMALPPPSWKHWNRASAPMPPPMPRRHSCGDHDDPQRTLRKGVVLAFIGLALTIGLSFIGFLVEPGRFVPGPWLLGGLIPLFVGLAQVATAVLFGAGFPAGHGVPLGGPPPPPGAGVPPSSPFEGPYTYRPDPSQPELGQSMPPDRR
jgi:hypothetical protein